MLTNLRSWFARDSWFGVDKLDHFAWSLAYWVVLTWWVSDLWSRIAWFAVGAVGLEIVQLVRFRAWVSRGRPHPQPFFTDGFSYKDIAWDVGGAIAAVVALAKIVGRAVIAVALVTLAASSAAAQEYKVKSAPEFDLTGVTFDNTAYGVDVPSYLPPLHGFLIRGPAGDLITLLNAPRFSAQRAPRCGAPAESNDRPAVETARLVIGNRDSVWWAQNFPARGEVKRYDAWQKVLASGDTLRLVEVWRRGSECATADGVLIVVFSFRRGR